MTDEELVRILRIAEEPSIRYAADRIEELEHQVNILRDALKELLWEPGGHKLGLSKAMMDRMIEISEDKEKRNRPPCPSCGKTETVLGFPHDFCVCGRVRHD